MISTVLVNRRARFVDTLETQINTYFPQIKISGKAYSEEEASQIIGEHHPDLVFVDISMISNIHNFQLIQQNLNFETIYLSSMEESDPLKSPNPFLGFISSPIHAHELIANIQYAQSRIELRKIQLEHQTLLNKLLRYSPVNDVITIPTIEGMEFLKREEIIRCEGLQKYTRVITTEKSDIISSYNIGEFCKLLDSYGFFSPHKSHLINLCFIRKFLSEGTIIMRDGSSVPVSRRRRHLFVQRVSQVKACR